MKYYINNFRFQGFYFFLQMKIKNVFFRAKITFSIIPNNWIIKLLFRFTFLPTDQFKKNRKTKKKALFSLSAETLRAKKELKLIFTSLRNMNEVNLLTFYSQFSYFLSFSIIVRHALEIIT